MAGCLISSVSVTEGCEFRYSSRTHSDEFVSNGSGGCCRAGAPAAEPVGKEGLLRAGEREAVSFRMAGHETWGPHPLCVPRFLSEDTALLECPQHHNHLVDGIAAQAPGRKPLAPLCPGSDRVRRELPILWGWRMGF